MTRHLSLAVAIERDLAPNAAEGTLHERARQRIHLLRGRIGDDADALGAALERQLAARRSEHVAAARRAIIREGGGAHPRPGSPTDQDVNRRARERVERTHAHLHPDRVAARVRVPTTSPAAQRAAAIIAPYRKALGDARARLNAVTGGTRDRAAVRARAATNEAVRQRFADYERAEEQLGDALRAALDEADTPVDEQAIAPAARVLASTPESALKAVVGRMLAPVMVLPGDRRAEAVQARTAALALAAVDVIRRRNPAAVARAMRGGDGGSR